MFDSKRWLFTAGFCLLMLWTVACSSKTTTQSERLPTTEESNVVSFSQSRGTTNPSQPDSMNAIKNAEKQSKQITYKATVTIDVNNYQQSRHAIEKLVSQSQGYLVHSSEQQHQKNEQTGTFTFRIPQKNFQTFINHLKTNSLDGNVRQITIQGNDVTEEMVDLEARLKAKKATEKRLFDLMNKATDSSSLLKISQQLDTIQAQIEQIEGRLQYLKNRVEFSEVMVTLTKKEVVSAPDNASMGLEMKEAFLQSIQWMINVGKNGLIFLAGAIPVLFGLSLIGIPIYLLIRNRLKKKNQVKAQR